MPLAARPGAVARVIEILWHCEGWQDTKDEKEKPKEKKPEPRPVQCIHFHPHEYRACTVGDDRTLKVWEISSEKAEEFLVGGGGVAAMEGICKCVASESLDDICLVVRWSPQGRMIAVGSSTGSIRIYLKDSENLPKEGMEERWKNDETMLVGHSSDITDMAFSPDSAHLVSCSMAGSVCIHQIDSVSSNPVWTGQRMHRSGRCVAWVPWNKLVATFGMFPSLKMCTVVRPSNGHLHLAYERKGSVHHAEKDSTNSFTMSFSPDGVYLAVPNGRSKEGCGRCAYIYLRNCIERPAVRLGFVEAAESAVLGCIWAPVFFEPHTLKQDHATTMERLPWGPYQEYRMALAMWTTDTVIVYTTDSSGRQSFFTDLHVRSITSVTWSPDAKFLLVSSLDCYVSIIHFAEPIGIPHKTLRFVPQPSVCPLLDAPLQAIYGDSMELEQKLDRSKKKETNIIVPRRKKPRTEAAPPPPKLDA